LENDVELKQAEEQAKETAVKSKERKSNLQKSPEYQQFRSKVETISDEIKELEESLNTHLLNYFQQTGVKSVDLSSGGQREFRILAKVLPRKE
jgi:hypothetical protein